MFRKNSAFTLAEVLIVIAVIGITATLALPNLTTNLDEKKTVSALRKIYPELSTAYDAVVSQYGKPPEWADAASNADANAMTKLLHDKMIKNLAISKDINNSHVILKDGAEVEFYLFDRAYMLNKIGNNDGICADNLGYMTVDINGAQKGENTSGYDRFEFSICYERGIMPSGESLNVGPKVFNGGQGVYNTAWVIKAGNMDYLKCIDDLDWNTKRTCK